MIRTQPVHICDFCGKTQHEVEKIIAGPKHPIMGQLCICDECVELCNEIVYEAREKVDLFAVRRDADRYRALRDVPNGYEKQIHIRCVQPSVGLDVSVTGEDADKAVDVLIARMREKNHGL